MKYVTIKVLAPVRDIIEAIGDQHELVPKATVRDARKVSRDVATEAFMEAAQSLSEAVERLEDVAFTRDERRATEAVVRCAKTLRRAFRTFKHKEMTNGN